MGDFVDEFGKPWFIETSFFIIITLNSIYGSQSNIYLIIQKFFQDKVELNGEIAKGRDDLQNEIKNFRQSY